jgi:hypothetical protein
VVFPVPKNAFRAISKESSANGIFPFHFSVIGNQSPAACA